MDKQTHTFSAAKEVSSSSSEIQSFIEKVWQQGEKLYRDLPWRNTQNPYEVLVSEIMLQQTQVQRVLAYWPRFLKLFPSVDALAAADVSVVLEAWQGLGYNRRALALYRCARTCSHLYQGNLPKTYDELLSLDGVGPATAGGVCAFAYNMPVVYLETNVRTVFLHEFFPYGNNVSDKELIGLIEASCSQDNPRSWYYALLDYGAYLKQTLPNPSRRSKHHQKQSTFEGSRRQKRSELLRIVLANPGITLEGMLFELNEFEKQHGRGVLEKDYVSTLATTLAQEGFFSEKEGTYWCE